MASRVSLDHADHGLPTTLSAPLASKVTGSRLNMAFVNQTVAQHGGSIGISSAPGQGTTLYFTWPSEPPASLESS